MLRIDERGTHRVLNGTAGDGGSPGTRRVRPCRASPSRCWTKDAAGGIATRSNLEVAAACKSGAHPPLLRPSLHADVTSAVEFFKSSESNRIAGDPGVVDDDGHSQSGSKS
jgi:hypothetical protein